MKFLESTLKEYAAPLSATEDAKCKRAIEMIRDALKSLGYTDDNKPLTLLAEDTASYSIQMRSRQSTEKVSIFVQGSYANNTCVRTESDVDIAVVREDLFEVSVDYYAGSSTTTEEKKAHAFKDAVEIELRKAFPYQVHRGNKSIKVEGNTYRKKADVVPCCAMTCYNKWIYGDKTSSQAGIVIYADDGQIIRNFPKQHIANGRKKNVDTGYRYKKAVRIFKKIRYLMEDCGYSSAKNISSFGLESLLWNVPDTVYTKYYTLGFIVDEVLTFLHNNSQSISSYKEANGIKKLCPKSGDADKYIEFIRDMNTFFDYAYGE